MNYIILAAGMGTRLHPFTKTVPKCLIKIGHGENLLQRMVRLIKKYDANANIFVVNGFKRDDVEKSIEGCSFIFNPFYAVTNSIASLWFANSCLDSDIVIINGDIVLSENIMHELVSKPVNAEVYLDSSIKTNGDYNVQVSNKNVVVMSKELNEYYGEYAGISKLSRNNSLMLKEEIGKMIEEGSFNEWYENALVNLILNSEFTLGFKDICEYDWTEVDSVNHLLLAREIQNKGHL